MRAKFIKWTIASLATVLVLFLVLVVHIYLVTKDKDPRNRQLARIDFMENVDSLDAMKIKNTVLGMHGVDAAHFNLEDNILVYSYNPDMQSQEYISSAIQQIFNYNFKPFKVDAEALSGACPIIDKSSFTYKLSSVITKVIQ